MTKPLTVWIQQTVENSSRDGNIRPPDLTAETSVCEKMNLNLTSELIPKLTQNGSYIQF